MRKEINDIWSRVIWTPILSKCFTLSNSLQRLPQSLLLLGSGGILGRWSRKLKSLEIWPWRGYSDYVPFCLLLINPQGSNSPPLPLLSTPTVLIPYHKGLNDNKAKWLRTETAETGSPNHSYFLSWFPRALCHSGKDEWHILRLCLYLCLAEVFWHYWRMAWINPPSALFFQPNLEVMFDSYLNCSVFNLLLLIVSSPKGT